MSLNILEDELIIWLLLDQSLWGHHIFIEGFKVHISVIDRVELHECTRSYLVMNQLGLPVCVSPDGFPTSNYQFLFNKNLLGIVCSLFLFQKKEDLLCPFYAVEKELVF
ncbi:hypothetical protein [Reichenbachiella agariperforans]|uniref:Uncharacterized protein n=1 Tax=Reichenbachiella agariperforans TaxID=156994 RepID=A0A1M6J8I8_REIAG|nr:hypothetical protein [Reichenbachiella agariperforans]MBU2913101.1 hypothetical protein [Reichenbachiella agariperforans]SHJ42991.1 hypothetical protein SAMN04488028_10185 [Reichenbachiella agariperforans]